MDGSATIVTSASPSEGAGQAGQARRLEGPVGLLAGALFGLLAFAAGYATRDRKSTSTALLGQPATQPGHGANQGPVLFGRNKRNSRFQGSGLLPLSASLPATPSATSYASIEMH